MCYDCFTVSIFVTWRKVFKVHRVHGSICYHSCPQGPKSFRKSCWGDLRVEWVCHQELYVSTAWVLFHVMYSTICCLTVHDCIFLTLLLSYFQKMHSDDKILKWNLRGTCSSFPFNCYPRLKCTQSHDHKVHHLLPISCCQAYVLSILAQCHSGEARLIRWWYKRGCRGRWTTPTAVPPCRTLIEVFSLQGETWMGRAPNSQGSQVFSRWWRRWLDYSGRRAPVSHLSRSVLSPLVQSVHALRRLPYPTSFLVSLSLSLPVPPHCQALERSRINVSFDYGGCMGDVRQAWQSPLMSWHTGSLVHLDRNIQRAHRWPVVVLLADV